MSKKIDFEQLQNEVLFEIKANAVGKISNNKEVEKFVLSSAELMANTCRLMLEKYHDLISQDYQ